MAGNFPRVLVACPTAAVKDYCFDEWIGNVMDFRYPVFDIAMFDNTADGGKYASKLNKRFQERFGYDKSRTFKAYNSFVLNRATHNLSVTERMAMSHNDCRRHTLDKKYDFLLHLESDVIPPKDTIERLLFHQKEFVSALYYSDEGKYRRAVVQMHLEICEDEGSVYWLSPTDEVTHLCGGLIKVALAGLGCSLIAREVLKKITFRSMKGVDIHPDTLFAEDCEKNSFGRYVDTSIVCKHKNRSWGIFGINYK